MLSRVTQEGIKLIEQVLGCMAQGVCSTADLSCSTRQLMGLRGTVRPVAIDQTCCVPAPLSRHSLAPEHNFHNQQPHRQFLVWCAAGQNLTKFAHKAETAIRASGSRLQQEKMFVKLLVKVILLSVSCSLCRLVTNALVEPSCVVGA